MIKLSVARPLFIQVQVYIEEILFNNATENEILLSARKSL